MRQPEVEPTSRSALVTRRFALTTGLALLAGVSGCRLRVGQPAPTTAPAPSPGISPDASLTALAAAAGQADGLARAYEQAAGLRPDLSTALAPLRSDHLTQLAALARLGATAAPATAASEPMTASTVTMVLNRSEQAASGSRTAALATVDGPTARFLASLVASSAQRQILLARLPAHDGKKKS